MKNYFNNRLRKLDELSLVVLAVLALNKLEVLAE